MKDFVKNDSEICEGCGRLMTKRVIAQNSENVFFWVCGNCNSTKRIVSCSIDYMKYLRILEDEKND